MVGTACPDSYRGPSMKPMLHGTVGSGEVGINLYGGVLARCSVCQAEVMSDVEIVFVKNHTVINVVRPEYHKILDEMDQIDPHDLVEPNSFFQSTAAARGYVFSIFLKGIKTHNLTES